MVYAIVSSGGGQQKAAVGDVIKIDKVPQAQGESVSLPPVLLVDDGAVTSDAEALSKIAVTGEVVEHTTGPKITIQKFKSKTGYRRRLGHRQQHTQVKITDIS